MYPDKGVKYPAASITAFAAAADERVIAFKSVASCVSAVKRSPVAILGISASAP
jgi:hypothetical protein